MVITIVITIILACKQKEPLIVDFGMNLGMNSDARFDKAEFSLVDFLRVLTELE
jgi:hypothetical protein